MEAVFVRPAGEFALAPPPSAINVPLETLEDAYCRASYRVLSYETVVVPVLARDLPAPRMGNRLPECRAAGSPVEEGRSR